jgi:ABC-type polysaccharide/polyol phosphate export permease
VHHQSPSLTWFSYSFVFTVSLLTVAIHLFRKLDPYFAECI